MVDVIGNDTVDGPGAISRLPRQLHKPVPAHTSPHSHANPQPPLQQTQPIDPTMPFGFSGFSHKNNIATRSEHRFRSMAMHQLTSARGTTCSPWDQGKGADLQRGRRWWNPTIAYPTGWHGSYVFVSSTPPLERRNLDAATHHYTGKLSFQRYRSLGWVELNWMGGCNRTNHQSTRARRCNRPVILGGMCLNAYHVRTGRV